MSQVVREGFAQFCKRQQEGISLATDAINQEESEQKLYFEWLEKRLDRKRKLLFDNLDLIMRHRDEIMKTPRYAQIDMHYALRGGGGLAGIFLEGFRQGERTVQPRKDDFGTEIEGISGKSINDIICRKHVVY